MNSFIITSLLQQEDVVEEVEVAAKEVTDDGAGENGIADYGRCRR